MRKFVADDFIINWLDNRKQRYAGGAVYSGFNKVKGNEHGDNQVFDRRNGHTEQNRCKNEIERYHQRCHSERADYCGDYEVRQYFLPLAIDITHYQHHCR